MCFLIIVKSGGRMINKKIVWLLFIGSTLIVWLTCCLSTSRVYENMDSSYHRRIPRAVSNFGDDLPPKNTSVADFLMQKVRVLCWVMTCPENHWKAMIVKNTWGKRCDILLFMSTEEETKLPTVKLSALEGSAYLWDKTKKAFKYVYKNYREDADWFLKTDDDTYVILENLRFYLSYYQPENNLFFGSRIKSLKYRHKGYMDGGAGYVLSRAALDTFINKALPASYLCEKKAQGKEDIEIARCLTNTKVKLVNTQDTYGRSRFLPFHLVSHIYGENTEEKSIDWYWKRVFYFEKPGLKCCSDYSITIHRVPPQKMYELEYFIYRLRPYGITHKFK